MVCELDAKYKGIREIKAGSFINHDGKTIKYPEGYRLFFDQIVDGLPKQCEIKISKETALNLAKNLNIYDNIVIKFSIIYYTAINIRVSVISVNKK